jgi:autotransporter-associated beta strand protein
VTLNRRRLSLTATAFILIASRPALAQTVELNETFTSATQTAGGWTLGSGVWPATNNSDNPQPYSSNAGAWGPGGGLFTSPPGGGYFATDTTATGNDNGTVSDWLMTPVIALHNGDTIKFYTRTRSPEEGPSRMEVRLSTNGTSSNVGTTNSSVGDFTTVLGTVNPSLTANTYPTSFTQFTYTVSGLAGNATGRLAFRTTYPNGGFGGPNGDTVGLASVLYTATAPTTVWTWTGTTSGSWNNTGNWSPTGIPVNNSSNQLVFGTTSNAVMTNDISGGLVLNQMTFNAGGPAYTLTGNVLNFQTSAGGTLPQIVTNSANTVSIGNQVTLTNSLTVNGTGTVFLNGAIGGAGSLTMNGSGLLFLGSSNSFTGGVNVLNGTVQVGTDAALGTGNVTGSSPGNLLITGSTVTQKNFAMGNGTITVPANQTLTLYGGTVSSALLDGAGTYLVNGAQLVNVSTMPSTNLTSNTAADQFRHVNNSGAITVSPGVNQSGVSTTLNFNGFTNQGLGSLTVGAQAQVNVANFQTYGSMTVNPATVTQNFSQTTLVTNQGAGPLGFNAGSRTFLGTPATAVFPQTWPDPTLRGLPTFVAGVDLHGQNAVVTSGLFVNNGYVEDTTNNNQGTATVIADYGSLVKGAGYFQNTVVTVNGGKFQAGNSPGKVIFGSLTVGPGGLSNFNWQINDAGPSGSFPSAPGVAGPSADANNQVSGWSLISSQKVRPTDTGNLTWTATNTPGNQFNISLQTLLGPKTTVGNDVQGAMTDFDPNLPYVWPLFSWTGIYSGPTDDPTLTASALIDKSNFVNTIPPGQQFVLHYDAADKQIDLVTPIPEPGTFAVTGLGLLAAWRYRRRMVASGRCLG